MIVIIDYGMGNLGSLVNMFKKLGYKSTITNDLKIISLAKKIILPGVGSFDVAMKRLKNKPGLIDLLGELVLKKGIPILGVCLGMQILTNFSEEGNHKGLGWIPAETLKFKSHSKYKVPHMGWNYINSLKKDKILKGIDMDFKYYFVHSYYVKVLDECYSLAKTDYTIKFDSIIKRKNIYGVQFHPEKSHKFGMKLLKNFVLL